MTKNGVSLNHARFGSTAIRAAWLQTTEKNPSAALKKLNKFHNQIFAPFKVLIKVRPYLIDATQLMLDLIISIHIHFTDDDPIDQKIKTACFRGIQVNAFMIHSENLLFGLLFSCLEAERLQAMTCLQIKIGCFSGTS